MLLVDILVVCVSDAEFRNTGLERSEALKKDLEWFRQQGHTVPEPSPPGTTYASLLEELSEKDPQAFICHFYNVYFAHTAGGRMIGKKVNRSTPSSEKMTNTEYMTSCQNIILAYIIYTALAFKMFPCLMSSNRQACLCIFY